MAFRPCHLCNARPPYLRRLALILFALGIDASPTRRAEKSANRMIILIYNNLPIILLNHVGGLPDMTFLVPGIGMWGCRGRTVNSGILTFINLAPRSTPYIQMYVELSETLQIATTVLGAWISYGI
jgi:hypothetical protein